MSSFAVAELEPFLTEAQIQARIDELAAEIRQQYGDEPLLMVGVLKGSLFILADLARRLGPNVALDFVQLSSYGDATESSGEVLIRKDLETRIRGRHVLVVEDIVDTGTTLKCLLDLLNTRHPASLRVLSLLSKPEARRHEAPIDYLGFEIPNKFVVGYGLDHAERWRNLPYIALLREP